ncbi:MAG: hypothetical protein KAS32_14945, partial [Candidatus Peribacteraceae bacterium]|nr:hypothetical protein [Candidatus Peribacteraceae bacterium]
KIALRGAGALIGKGPRTVRSNAGMYWLRAGFLFTVGLDAAQWMLHKAINGKGKHLWENDPGHLFSIELPWHDEKGRKQYVKPLKQAREVLRYFTNPMEIVGNKLSPTVRVVIEQFTGHSPGGGFKQALADMDFYEGLPERGKAIVDKVVPLSFKKNNFAFVLPKSTGMNNYKTVKLYTENLRAWAEDVAQIKKLGKSLTESELVEQLNNISRASKENNLDTKQLFTSAVSGLRTKYYSELFKAINENDKEESERWAKAINRLGGNDKTIEKSLRKKYERALRENTLDITSEEARHRLEKAKGIKTEDRSKPVLDIKEGLKEPSLEPKRKGRRRPARRGRE